jgi:hypothetical protein
VLPPNPTLHFSFSGVKYAPLTPRQVGRLLDGLQDPPSCILHAVALGEEGRPAVQQVSRLLRAKDVLGLWIHREVPRRRVLESKGPG